MSIAHNIDPSKQPRGLQTEGTLTMAAEGTKKMTANLELQWRDEMRKDVVKWIQSEKDVIKLFPKTITYSQKVELNPAKWDEGKLKKALPRMFRQELKHLANRMSDAMKLAEKSKSPKEHNKVLTSVKTAIADTQKEIYAKCDELLDDLHEFFGILGWCCVLFPDWLFIQGVIIASS